MMKRVLSATFTVAVLLAAAQSALADRYERGWGGGDIRHFDAHDMHRWRGGHWVHGRHGGHLGWWWVAAGIWYFYPAPVYPYPNPYVPPIVVQQPPVIIQQAPPAPASSPPPAAAPQAPQYWYYCESTKAYYPYVSSCSGGWKKVPATPQDAPQQ